MKPTTDVFWWFYEIPNTAIFIASLAAASAMAKQLWYTSELTKVYYGNQNNFAVVNKFFGQGNPQLFFIFCRLISD